MMKEYTRVRQNAGESPRRCFSGGGGCLYIWGCGEPGTVPQAAPQSWELELPSGRVIRGGPRAVQLFEPDQTRAPFRGATARLLSHESWEKMPADRQFVEQVLASLPQLIAEPLEVALDLPGIAP